MQQTNTLIIGASFSGLASAACLQKQNIEFIIIEKQKEIAAPWRNYYARLHLHTNKRLSSLPYKKFKSEIPRYPSRQQVLDYIDDYQKSFHISPVFDTKAISVTKSGEYWITQTTNGSFKSKYVIVATGLYGKPKAVSFKGMETFTGKILHSSDYKSGKDFKGKNVLVVGFGNSACEIAIDLYEQKAMPSLSVRSPVNVIPRDVLGIPVLELSLLLKHLPPRVADIVSYPAMRLSIGNLTKLGLTKLPYGPVEQISKYATAPVLDIGTIKHIREGHIKVYGDIDFIETKTIFFKDGKSAEFDAIIAAIGYQRSYSDIAGFDEERLEDLIVCVDKQKYFGKNGLYFCGFWVSPTGQIREIALDAKKIAIHIATNSIT